MIYLDNSATTKPDATVLQSFMQVNEKYYGNPSSIHKMGGEVEKLQTKAREQAAQLLGVNPSEIIFTSGGTEGNNMAIKGIALQHQQRGKHIITSSIEHPAVYDACLSLEKLGFTVTVLPVNEDGIVDVEALKAAITEETILVSIMHVNNEIGAIQPMEEIGEIVRAHKKIFFHVDAVQALGKIPVHIKRANVDLCTFSGHKINGLKGTGLLYVRDGVTLFPLFHGGGQEHGLRSGTENVAGNVAFVRALRLILECEAKKSEHLHSIQKQLLEGLAEMAHIYVNSTAEGAPHIVHFSVPGIKPEVLIHALYEEGIILSTKSACSSKQEDKSRVLEACGKSEEIATSGIRLSTSYHTTEAEVTQFLTVLHSTVTQLKGILG